MELDALISIQRRFDQEHGWALQIGDATELLKSLERELIGLMGEVGEVANCLKKLRLKKDAACRIDEAMNNVQPELREELIDSFIYLLRLFALTNTDIEAEYIRKLNINKERYKQYEDADH